MTRTALLLALLGGLAACDQTAMQTNTAPDAEMVVGDGINPACDDIEDEAGAIPADFAVQDGEADPIFCEDEDDDNNGLG
ncbi:hypothetical protein [Wenxinia saemankumensis]|uniref:Secreted protein n=1 Tax=Wenxinia saemankumensis TaxID=1447782 RepID=A0A1M6EX69_9RHOB|nr:hypothetical protein [Wenxinia saemankumensis]SHI90087.1 hypothetical protein SAMN05444417_2228 [Wenxinia saemankumensis]